MGKSFSTFTSRTGEQPLEFRRINVILGANGTGKSRLLTELLHNIKKEKPDYSALVIEGGRAIKINSSLMVNSDNFRQYQTYDQTIHVYKSKRDGPLANRLFDALKYLEKLSEKHRHDHSDEVTSWISRNRTNEEGRPSDVPIRPIDPMLEVFQAFSDIFPTIQLKYINTNQNITCIKNSIQYPLSQMSDGEKQVFSILVDLFRLSENKLFLLVDEPELNLNPGLANRVWNTIEQTLPDAIFVYATHSVNFALRENVELRLVLSNEDSNIQEIGNISELNKHDRYELVGTLPSLIENRVTLVVEGEMESFDKIFYDWILMNREVSVQPVGSSEDVKAIVKRIEKWRAISPNTQLIGLVDRDYKGEQQISELSEHGLMVLDFHEVESYLCHPRILVKIASALRTAETIPTESCIEQMILDFCSRERLSTIGRRTSEQVRYRGGVSVRSGTLSKLTTAEDLKKLFLDAAQRERSQVLKVFDESAVSSIIHEEAHRIDKAILDRSIDDLLSLFSGKEMLKELLKAVGCRDSLSIVRAARYHLDSDHFDFLTPLRTRLRDAVKCTALGVEASELNDVGD